MKWRVGVTIKKKLVVPLCSCIYFLLSMSQENKIRQMVEGSPSFGHFGLTNATANQLETWFQMKTQIAGDIPSPSSYHAIEVIVRSWLR